MLNKIKGYAEIKTRNIQNWYTNKTKVLKKKGVKVISSFEEEVLGNLMICVFEKADNVSNAMIFSCHLLLRIFLICHTRMHKMTTVVGQMEKGGREEVGLVTGI